MVERYAYINAMQNDICIMKNLDVTFIDANWCFLPVDISRGPFLYVCNTYLRQYARDLNMNLPDALYRSAAYRRDLIREFLEYYRLPLKGWWFLNKENYIYESCNVCINEELTPDFLFLPYGNLCEFMDEQEIRRRIMKYLTEYRLVSDQWRHVDLYQEFTNTIEEAIAEGKQEFLIYPFGRNGMFLKRLLNEQYDIEEKMIFDNKLWKYNAHIRPVRDIKSYYNEKTCLILTSNQVSCRDELLKYCEMNIVEGPFAFLEF